jgi:hypothetical protein
MIQKIRNVRREFGDSDLRIGVESTGEIRRPRRWTVVEREIDLRQRRNFTQPCRHVPKLLRSLAVEAIHLDFRWLKKFTIPPEI